MTARVVHFFDAVVHNMRESYLTRHPQIHQEGSSRGSGEQYVKYLDRTSQTCLWFFVFVCLAGN